VIFVTVVTTVSGVAVVHEQMHQRAGKQQEVGQDAEQMRPMFRDEKESDDAQTAPEKGTPALLARGGNFV